MTCSIQINVVPLLYLDGPNKDKAQTSYLFKNHCKLTIKEGADSYKYCLMHITFQTNPRTGNFSRELARSYSYFHTHVELSLYEATNREFLCFY